jgi:hypothetical protein
MHRLSRSLVVLVLVAAAVAACSSADMPVTPRLSPVGGAPMAIKLKASDSTMALTDTAYSDTTMVLQRLTPLASDISVSAAIGTAGGTLRIDEAGVVLTIPAGALTATTTITMTAHKGTNVAYGFKPHGITFAAPLKMTQDLRGTQTSVNVTLLKTLHGAYYGTSLDSAFVDVAKGLVKVQENELSYRDLTNTQARIYIDHFSGYMLACGVM